MDGAIGLGQFWSEGDAVIRFVALLLVSMSVVTWSVLLLKLLQVHRLRRQARAVAGWAGWTEADRRAWRSAAELDDPHAQLAQMAEASTQQLAQAQGRWQGMAIDPSEWVARQMQQTLDRQWASLQSNMTLLASVGATSPFVGLFGTVWGIYHALMNMGQAGQASIDQVAGPVGEALVMTAVGLAVAIPAVLAYNALLRLSKNRMAGLREFAGALHAQALLSGARGAQGD
jgi:biopolymer transport protein ExbB